MMRAPMSTAAAPDPKVRFCTKCGAELRLGVSVTTFRGGAIACVDCAVAAEPAATEMCLLHNVQHNGSCFLCEPAAVPRPTAETGTPDIEKLLDEVRFEMDGAAEEARTAIESYVASLLSDRALKDDYAAAARSIALNLAEFCDDSLAYPEMIAEASRRARTELESLRADRALLNELREAFVTPENRLALQVGILAILEDDPEPEDREIAERLDRMVAAIDAALNPAPSTQTGDRR